MLIGFSVLNLPLSETWLPLLLLFYLAMALIISVLIAVGLYLKQHSGKARRKKSSVKHRQEKRK